jgi:outer membrane protein assembly factor BamB
VGSAADDGLLVLDRRDGALLDRLPAGGAVQAAPLVDEERVLFTDSAGNTWCYALEGGPALWSHFSGAPILAPPTVHESVVFVHNVDNLVYALDAETGDLLWRHEQKLDVSRSSVLELFAAPEPIVAGSWVVTGHSDGTVVALEQQTGEVAWQRRVGEGQYPDLVAPPLVIESEGLLIVGGYVEPLVALGLDDQQVRWRIDTGAYQAPVFVDGVIYQGGIDGLLRAIEPDTGELIWTWDSETAGALTKPVVTDAGLLLGSTEGALFLVDAQTGEETWTLEPGLLVEGITVPPAVEGRQAVALTNAGRLWSLVVPPTVTEDRAKGPWR